MLIYKRNVTCVLAILVFVSTSFIRVSDQLECCIGITILESRDEQNGPKYSCTNIGTSCSDVGCDDNKCLLERSSLDDNLETNCSATKTCPNPTDVCRLLYVEYREANPPPPPPPPTPTGEPVASDIDPRVDFKEVRNSVVQECASNEDQLEIGCDFSHKIFYQSKAVRVTLEKDCYCNTPKCNADISTTCVETDPTIPNANQTCQDGAERCRGNAFMVLSYLIVLTVSRLCV